MGDKVEIIVRGEAPKIPHDQKPIFNKMTPELHGLFSRVRSKPDVAWDTRTGRKSFKKDGAEWEARWPSRMGRDNTTTTFNYSGKRGAALDKLEEQRQREQEESDKERVKAAMQKVKWEDKAHAQRMKNEKMYMSAIVNEQNRIRYMNIQSGKWFKANVSQVHDAIGSLLGWRAYRAAKWTTQFMSQWESGKTPDIIKAVGGFGKVGKGVEDAFVKKFMKGSPKTGAEVPEGTAVQGLQSRGVTQDSIGRAVYSNATGYTTQTSGNIPGEGSGVSGVGVAQGVGSGTGGLASGTSATAGGTSGGGGMAAIAGIAGVALPFIIAGVLAILVIAKVVQKLLEHSEAWAAIRTSIEMTLGSITDTILIGAILLTDILSFLNEIPELLGEIWNMGDVDWEGIASGIGTITEGISVISSNIGEWMSDAFWDALNFFFGWTEDIDWTAFNGYISSICDAVEGLQTEWNKLFPSGTSMAQSITNFLSGSIDLSSFSFSNLFKPLDMFDIPEGGFSLKLGEVFSLGNKFSLSAMFDSFPGIGDFTPIDLNLPDMLNLKTFSLSDIFSWEVFDLDLSEYVNLKKIKLSDAVEGVKDTVVGAATSGVEAVDRTFS